MLRSDYCLEVVNLEDLEGMVVDDGCKECYVNLLIGLGDGLGESWRSSVT